MKLFKLFLQSFFIVTIIVTSIVTYLIHDHMKINDFELDQLTILDKNGNQKTLGEFRNGKAILVNFGGPGCPGCELERPSLIKLYNKSLNQDEFVVISIALDDIERQREYLAKRGQVIEFAQLLDTEKLGSHPIPLTLYFNSKGERIKQFSGGQPWDSEEMLAYLIENK